MNISATVDEVMYYFERFGQSLEEELKGLLWGEILGHEVMYTQFDTELVERLVQLGKCSVRLRVIITV